MAYVYLLYSASIDRFYTGSCKNLQQRLEDHSNKKYEDSFTKRANDWTLFASFGDFEYQQARKIEQHIKKNRNRTYFRNLVLYPEIIEKLRNKYAPENDKNSEDLGR